MLCLCPLLLLICLCVVELAHIRDTTYRMDFAVSCVSKARGEVSSGRLRGEPASRIAHRIVLYSLFLDNTLDRCGPNRTFPLQYSPTDKCPQCQWTLHKLLLSTKKILRVTPCSGKLGCGSLFVIVATHHPIIVQF